MNSSTRPAAPAAQPRNPRQKTIRQTVTIFFLLVLFAFALFMALLPQATKVGAQTGGAPLIISEFRLRGPNGANDEFIEIYNNSGTDHTVAGGGVVYAVAASDGVARCITPV